MTLEFLRRASFLAAGLLLAVCAVSLPLTAPPASAQSGAAPAGAEDKQKKIAEEQKAAYAAAKKAQHVGPEKIALQGQGFVDLPQGYIFVPQPEADAVLKAQGGFGSPQTLGLVFPQADDQNWWARLDFRPEGYIKDDDARNWNADELLTNLKEGTEEGNGERIQRGYTPIEVTGWVEKPAYDSGNHRLVWSAMVRDKGVAADAGSVNYNTYALGREGYFSLNLITAPDAIGKDKASAGALLAALSYAPGKDYGDFNASTDHTAEYGLAALIGGVAAKKLGLLALGAAFFVKFAKIIAIVVLGFGATIVSFFRRKKPDA